MGDASRTSSGCKAGDAPSSIRVVAIEAAPASDGRPAGESAGHRRVYRLERI
jgi:hypothetical protein